MIILQYVPDLVFILIVVATAAVVSRKLVVEAGLFFLATLMSSVTAIVLFEPFADWVRRTMFVGSDFLVVQFLWIFFVIVIFTFLLVLLTVLFFRIVDQPPVFSDNVETFGGWGFAVLTGYTLAAFFLTCLHAMPAPRDFWGFFPPEAERRAGPVVAFAPDYQLIWIAERVSKPLTAAKPTTKRKFTPTARLVNQERLQWFPVRFAVWRERLEWYKSPDSGDDPAEASDDVVLVADRASTEPQTIRREDDSATSSDDDSTTGSEVDSGSSSEDDSEDEYGDDSEDEYGDDYGDDC